MDSTEKNFEMDNQAGTNQEGTNANRPVRRLTATSIIGDDIESPDGESLGTVKNLMIDINQGRIDYVVLKFGGFLGLGQKLFAIPWKEFQLDPLREVFILNRDKEYLKNSPGFDEEHWPNTNTHEEYYSSVINYWEAEPVASPKPGSPLSAYY